MNPALIFRYRQKDQPEPFETKVLDTLLSENFPDLTFESVSNMKDFQKAIQNPQLKLVVFDWASCPFPAEVIEAYYQSAFCRTLMVIYHNGLRKTEKFLLQEYSIRELAEVKDGKIRVAYADLIAMMKEVLTPTRVPTKIRKAQIGIHFYLNNGKIDKAEEMLAKVQRALPVDEQRFYDALMLKSRKEYAKALAILEAIPVISVKVLGMIGTIYYYMQNYEKSEKYFKKIASTSPLHLRRNILYAKNLEILSEKNALLRKDAMGVFLAIYRNAPTYPGVIGEIVMLVTETESIDNIPIMTALLDQIPHRELMRIYKKIDKFNEPFKTKFTEIFVTAMSKIANRMIQEDDLGALNYYKNISKLIPEADLVRKKSLEYCLARAYFRFGQLEIAREICDKVLANGPHEKAEALSLLIDKALKGEFDVLLDDEKDWLIQNRSA